MNSAVLSALESAGWPAIVVETATGACHSNAAAKKLFGPVLEAAQPNLSAILATANTESVLSGFGSSPTTVLEFRDREGKEWKQTVTVCPFTEEGHKYVLLQVPFEGADSKDGKESQSTAGIAQKQKLECALQLARTVSLDFNNALTSILGHTSLILSRMEPGHPWRSSLIEVEKSAAKAAEIANDLGTFSRQEKETPTAKAGNLNSLLQRSVEFFQQNSGGGAVTWSFQFERKLFAVKFDEAKMQQAFLKILENAVQALGPNGKIVIQTRNRDLRESIRDYNVQLAAGAYVCAEISDNGCGIAPEVLPRVFEPFFTTKQNAKNRGLGLAWVYGIITNHGGGVAISSQPGTGTSVRVYLPAETKVLHDTGDVSGDLSGTESVLMVDDEDLLLTMGKTILSSYGYEVTTANSGRKALEVIAAAERPIDLVITDLVMPMMSGRELVEHINRVAPQTRILRTTGYVWPAGQEDGAALLQKPFTTMELLQKVKQALA